LNEVRDDRRVLILGISIALGALVAAVIIRALWSAYNANHPYIIGDWEIHYAGGFVRRGLVGEIVRALSNAFSIEPRVVVIVLQVLAYAFFFVAGLTLVLPVIVESPRFAFLVCSPLTFSFAAVSPEGGGRKEILFLAALSFQALTLVRHPGSGSIAHLAVLSAFDVALVLSHEVLILFIPFQFLLVRWCSPGPVTNSRLVVAAVPVAVAFIAAALFHGNQSQVATICSSLGENAPERCNDFSAISWLGVSNLSAIKSGYYMMTQPPFIEITTAQGFLLGLVPFSLLAANGMIPTLLQERLRERGGQMLLIACLLLPLPGFVVGTDHGRWMFVWWSAAMLVLAATARTRRAEGTESGSGRFPWMMAFWSIFLLLYATAWNMPGVCCPEAIGRGALGRLVAAIPF